MSYSFEDTNADGELEGGKIETRADLTRGGVPRWLMVALGAGAFVLFMVARSSLPANEAASPPTTESTVGFSTTTQPAITTAEAVSNVLVTSPPNQLTHADIEWSSLGVGPNRSIAVRSGNDVLVINPVADTAHQIKLPTTGEISRAARTDFEGQSISLVAGKLITYDNGFLRSLSVGGGVDVLLSNSSLGFEVATPTAIVAATQVISSADAEPPVRMVPQGVHFPSGRDQVVGAFGEPDLDELPPGAKVAAVQEKLFVLLDGEVYRRTPDGLVSLGVGRAFASSGNAVIMERCLVLFEDCSYFRMRLDDPRGTEVELDVPRSFSWSNIVMSPDGNMLVVIDGLGDKQSLVDISDGSWSEVHEFDLGPLTAAAFDEVSGSWLLAISESVVFWDRSAVGVWRIPGFKEVSEIAIARQVG